MLIDDLKSMQSQCAGLQRILSKVDQKLNFQLIARIEMRQGGGPWMSGAIVQSHLNYVASSIETMIRDHDRGKRHANPKISYRLHIPEDPGRWSVDALRQLFLTTRGGDGYFKEFLQTVSDINRLRTKGQDKQNQREAIATLVWDAHCHSGKELPRDAAAGHVRIAIRANGWQLAADAPHLWQGEATSGVFDESDVGQCVSIIEKIPGDIERAVSSGKFLIECEIRVSAESAAGEAVVRGRPWGLEGSPKDALVTREAIRELRQITQAEADEFISRPRG